MHIKIEPSRAKHRFNLIYSSTPPLFNLIPPIARSLSCSRFAPYRASLASLASLVTVNAARPSR